MKIYTIATETNECYGSGGFPPSFTTREAAAEWLKANGKTFYSKTAIVEIELLGANNRSEPTR